MTPRERVLAAMHRQGPDRVPINYMGNSGIDQRLCTHFGLAAGDHEGLLTALEVDHRKVWPAYTGTRHQRIVDAAKSFGLPVMIHSCGSSSWAFNDFIDMGIDVVDTLQPEARDMAPGYLKVTYGHSLAFHGCISTAGPLAYGTADEVEEYCRQTLGIMMPGGGYLFAPTHQEQDNSPLENVLRMFEAARTYGQY